LEEVGGMRIITVEIGGGDTGKNAREIERESGSGKGSRSEREKKHVQKSGSEIA